MRAQLFAGLRAILVLTVLCGLAYPLFITGIAQGLFHDKADGSLIKVDGKVVGSKLIGQSFTESKYFHPRPSAAGDAAFGVANGDLSAVASGASNYGPTNKKFLDLVAERVSEYRDENNLSDSTRVPVDAVTASGSGLDPEISIANARLQAARVADARGIDVAEVSKLIDDHTDNRSLDFLGEKGVNVLELNLALDAVSH